MRFDWRVSAGAAGAAVFLSLVTGLISGVPFATLLGRALVGAVLFAALAAAISWVVDKYLPDLKTTRAGSPDSDPVGGGESRSGSLVDIVVDDPADVEEPAEELELEEAEVIEDGADAYEQQAADAEPEAEEIAELEAADESVEQSTDRSAYAETDDSDDAGELEEVSDVELAGRLPDIEGLSEGFSDDHAAVEDVDDSGRSGEDPSIMARAIRTVLKREE